MVGLHVRRGDKSAEAVRPIRTTCLLSIIHTQLDKSEGDCLIVLQAPPRWRDYARAAEQVAGHTPPAVCAVQFHRSTNSFPCSGFSSCLLPALSSWSAIFDSVY